MKDHFLRKAILGLLIGVVCGAGCFLLMQPEKTQSGVEWGKTGSKHPGEISPITPQNKPQQQPLVTRTELSLKSKQDFESEAFLTLVESNPAAAFAEIQKLENKSDRESLFKAAIKRLVDFDLESAKTLLAATQDTWLRNEMSAAIASVWGKRDPQAALAYSGLSSKEKFWWVNGVMDAWAQSNPAAAAAACKSLSAGRERNAAVIHVATQWKRLDLKAAADLVFNNPPGSDTESEDQGDTNMADVMGTWVETDVPSALEWLKTLPDGSRKDVAAHAALVTLTRSDVSAAKEFLGELSVEQIRRSAGSLAGMWASHSPIEAAEWVASMGDEKAQVNAVRMVMSYWGQANPAGAAQWLEKLPDGAMRDSGTQYLAYSVSDHNPSQGMRVAVNIGDPKLRERVLRNVATPWLIRDPVAATRWIQNTLVVTPEMQDFLLREP